MFRCKALYVHIKARKASMRVELMLRKQVHKQARVGVAHAVNRSPRYIAVQLHDVCGENGIFDHVSSH